MYNVDTHAFRQNFWMINTSNCCTIESIKNDIMILFLLFLMLYCNMINVHCVFIIFRSACLLSSCYLRSVVSNVHAISFQKIYIEKLLMRCWHFNYWSSAKRWRCVDMLLTKRLLFLIFVMMIVCLIIFVLCNYRFSNTWYLYLKMTKIHFSKRMIWSQQFKQFVRSFFSFFHQRSDFFSTQMRCYFFVLFLMQNRFKKSHVIQFDFLLDFYLALKRLNRMIFIAIDAFSSFNRRCACAVIVWIRVSCAASFIFAWFFNVIITLTIKTLFQSAIFVEIFTRRMRIFI